MRRRTSSVIVAMATRVLSGWARRARRERERGGRLIRLVKRRRRTTALKGAEVRPEFQSESKVVGFCVRK